MRVTGIWSLAGAVLVGLIVADLVTHINGTKAISNGIISLEKNTGNQLIGVQAR